MTDLTNNDLIDSIVGNEEATIAEKLHMWVMLCDEDALSNSLKKTAMMAKIGMVVPSPVDAFAYGALRIAKPHLFESAEDRRAND